MIIQCVGYIINRNGLRPLPRNITKALSIKFEKIVTLRDFKIWHGMVEFLNKYILNCAQELKILRKMMVNKGIMKKINKSDKNNKQKMQARLRSKLIKSDMAKKQFYDIQRKIENTPLLYHPDMRSNAQSFLLKCDTSGVQIGASLWQLRGKHYLLIKLFSVVLSLPQQNYSATERECLGYCISMTKFEKYLKSRDFILIGDHEPLLKLFNINYNTKNKKLLRWSIQMSSFSFRFEHHKGTSIALAMEDYLSRLANPTENAVKFIDSGIKVPVYEEIKKVYKIRLQSFKYESCLKKENVAIEKIDATHIMQAYNTNNIHKICKITQNVNYNPNIIALEKIYEANNCKEWMNNKTIANISIIKKIYSKTIESGKHFLEQIYETPAEMMLQYNAQMITRAQKAQKELNIDFVPRKSYLFDQMEGNIFVGSDENALKIVFDAQQKEYKELIFFIQTRSEEYEKFINFNNLDLYALAKKNMISINEEGILVYKKIRIVIPSKLRVSIMHYYHTSPSNGHRGFLPLYNCFIKRFYWPGMDQDIKIYVNQCICNVAKYPHRKRVGVKDIGYETVYFVSEPNEIIFLDLYGPMEDGNYIVLMADAFDGYTVLVPLEPVFNLDALSIIKVIMFEWIYKLGLMKQIITDNGSNLVSKLNKLANYIFGIKSKEIFAYSPWVNGKAESRMKLLTRGCMINNYHRELIGLRDVYIALSAMDEKHTNYRDLLPSIMLCHNSNIQQGTKMTPNALRFTNEFTNMLDIQLRISGIKKIVKDDYIKDNVIDFNKFKHLLNEQRNEIKKYAKINNLKNAMKKRLKNDEKSLENAQIFKDNYVVLKKNFKSKKNSNHEYGWVVIEVVFTNNKKKFKIKNIFSKQELTVNKGQIYRFHKPLFKEPEMMLENEITRLLQYN